MVPVDLVIDHSVQVDVARSENVVQANMELEFQINSERFAFLKWGSKAFHNMLVVRRVSGFVHQNTEDEDLRPEKTIARKAQQSPKGQWIHISS
ncbi:hypothetical protein L1987_30684 [Smallanthus sonchifolius]|uniref:Uncharacterized protein n=1 Tax=Smallanthus sonchifolius TaxID=185202 RepID=A0ACB9I4P2_9ASTR|nr:hypothetical protein L1987_30684 [Smallanthus sonchifolius]